MRKKKLIYIAMPYTAETPEGIAQNIENARQFVRENFPSDSEFFPVIPHNTGIGVEKLGGKSYWYDATESLMLACSAVVLGPGWRDSRGARNELLAARRAGIPVVEAQLVGVGLVERLRIITDRKLGDMTLTDITEEYTRTAYGKGFPFIVGHDYQYQCAGSIQPPSPHAPHLHELRIATWGKQTPGRDPRQSAATGARATPDDPGVPHMPTHFLPLPPAPEVRK